MDCEKFEAVLLDELEGDLDELTSAAAKRHLAGCARCAALFSGLRATRRVAVVPLVEPPVDLEDRILAAARSAQTAAPLKRRVGRAISWAGNWAMRPQTAMAAVFLLMIGSSLLFLRGKSRSPASAMHVTEEGAPAPAASAGLEHPADEPLAQATVAPELKKGAFAPGNTATLAADDSKEAPRRKDAKESATREKAEAEAYAMDTTAANPAAPAAAPPPPPAQEPAKAMGVQADLGSLGGGGVGGPFASSGQQLGRASGARGGGAGSGDGVLQGQGDPFGAAMGAYQRGAYDEALQGFDRLGGGDVNAALWAARSARNGAPKCSGAVSRFDDVARRAPGTITGWDALLEGGQCYRLIGQPDAARTRLTQLLTVSSHAERARRELQWLSGGGAPAAAKAAPQATQPPPATEKR